MSFLDSLGSFFSQGTAAPTDWAGGQIGLNNGVATYTSPTGDTTSFTQSTNPWKVAQAAPEIGEQWENKWGMDVLDEFMPNQMSLFGQDVSKLKGPQTTSMSGGSSSSQSKSGINWGSDFMQNLTPVLEESYQNLPQNIDDWTQSSQDLYDSILRKNIDTQIPQALESLQSRNMLNSSVAGDTLSKLANELVQGGAQKQYETAMTSAELKAKVPELLGALANLGQESTGSSSSSQSSSSQSTNDLAPLQLMLSGYSNL